MEAWETGLMGDMAEWMPGESLWKSWNLHHFPSTQGDLKMGFLLI